MEKVGEGVRSARRSFTQPWKMGELDTREDARGHSQGRREEQLVKQEAIGVHRTEPTGESTQQKQVEKQKDKMSINHLVQVKGNKDWSLE